MSRYEYGFPKYISVEVKRAKAEKKLAQLKKKNPDISPIRVEGRKLADSWWGISWNKNLESYADFANRMGRGRSYLRHGSVLDLRIAEGKVLALVQGGSSKPYNVEITIKKLKSSVWETIIKECRGEMDSLKALMDGKLPKSMETLLTDPESGIFPSPSEISFYCSCPDSARMCKHVAAALYGVGKRLDEAPSLFFTLRGVRMEELVSQAVRNETEDLLKRARTKTSRRIIKDADLSSAFGIEMEDLPAPAATIKKAPEEAIPRAKLKKATPGKAAKKVMADTSDNELPVKKDMDYEAVVAIIRRRRVKGIGVKEIKEKTGINDTKIRNIIFRAKQQNRIENLSRGLYIKGN